MSNIEEFEILIENGKQLPHKKAKQLIRLCKELAQKAAMVESFVDMKNELQSRDENFKKKLSELSKKLEGFSKEFFNTDPYDFSWLHKNPFLNFSKNSKEIEHKILDNIEEDK